MDTAPTPLEERAWTAFARAMNMKAAGTLADNPGQLEWFRPRLREIAYHEAGHVAVDAFFWLTYGHIHYVTILTKGTAAGHFIRERVLPASCRQEAWKQMMVSLGGWCAAQRSKPDGLAVADYISDRTAELDDNDLWDWETDLPDISTDEGSVWRLATALASRSWPRDRIIRQGVAWTFEVLEAPEVWQSVETAAADLLMRGSIRAGLRMDRIFRPGLWFKSPHREKWFRRLPPRPQPKGPNNGAF